MKNCQRDVKRFQFQMIPFNVLFIVEVCVLAGKFILIIKKWLKRFVSLITSKRQFCQTFFQLFDDFPGQKSLDTQQSTDLMR